MIFFADVRKYESAIAKSGKILYNLLWIYMLHEGRYSYEYVE